MLHITVIANEKKKRKKKYRVGWGEEMQKKKGTLGASGGKKEKGKEMREVWEDGWSCGKREGGIRNWSGERMRGGRFWHTGSLRVFSFSSVLLFFLVCDTDSRGKCPKTVDEKGNPIKLRLHLLSVHLTSSVIFQLKPPGPDRSGPTHVNTNLWKTLGSVAARKKPTNCPVFSRLNTASCVRFSVRCSTHVWIWNACGGG